MQKRDICKIFAKLEMYICISSFKHRSEPCSSMNTESNNIVFDAKVPDLYWHLVSHLPSERKSSEVLWSSVANGTNKKIKPTQINTKLLVHCISSSVQSTKDFKVKHLIVCEGWCEDVEEKAALSDQVALYQEENCWLFFKHAYRFSQNSLMYECFHVKSCLFQKH